MIELCHIDVSFDGQAVLRDFSATIPLDGNTVIFGASGSGKTTLLRILLGLQKPDAGTLRGMERLIVSAVFQEDRLLPWMTALQNVALVSDARVAERLLSQLGLVGAMGERPEKLSGGMKRRVAIARALAYPCDILLLDEPFNGLDHDAKALAANAILGIGKPVVVVTHSQSEAALLEARHEVHLLTVA